LHCTQQHQAELLHQTAHANSLINSTNNMLMILSVILCTLLCKSQALRPRLLEQQRGDMQANPVARCPDAAAAAAASDALKQWQVGKLTVTAGQQS
jgi:hypothetical protein